MKAGILTATLVLGLSFGSATAFAAAQKGAPEKMLTVSGTISKLEATQRSVTVSGNGSATRFVWTAETKINGTLTPGAKVTIRYTTLSDGQNLAHQINVGR